MNYIDIYLMMILLGRNVIFLHFSEFDSNCCKILQILLFIATNMTDISWGDILEIDIKI